MISLWLEWLSGALLKSPGGLGVKHSFSGPMVEVHCVFLAQDGALARVVKPHLLSSSLDVWKNQKQKTKPKLK